MDTASVDDNLIAEGDNVVNGRVKTFDEIISSNNAIDISNGKKGVIKVPLFTPRIQVKNNQMSYNSISYIVHYEAFFEGHAKPFDSSYVRGKPNNWKLDCLVPGLALAWVSSKNSSNCRCLYQIELLKIRPSANLQDDATAQELKVQGNYLYDDNRITEAMRIWQKALDICRNSNEKNKELVEILHLNIARVALIKKDWRKAKRHATFAVRINRFSVKGLYRLAVSSRHLGDFQEAKSNLLNLLKLEPQSSSARKELLQLEADIISQQKSTSDVPYECGLNKVPDEHIKTIFNQHLDEFKANEQNKIFTIDAELFDSKSLEYLINLAESKDFKTRIVSYDGVKVLHVLK
ncbi:hypothetical protein GJ496_004072 [Pomphorhynchus laevis]|nr:hypothetical protein GJ496_004072 [Pomphorhynchus laevis]